MLTSRISSCLSGAKLSIFSDSLWYHSAIWFFWVWCIGVGGSQQNLSQTALVWLNHNTKCKTRCLKLKQFRIKYMLVSCWVVGCPFLFSKRIQSQSCNFYLRGKCILKQTNHCLDWVFIFSWTILRHIQKIVCFLVSETCM